MPGRTPESAPHCPRCGYNLFGLEELRCPECGHKIETDDEHEKARWLADDSAADRAALRNQKLALIVGLALAAVGIGLAMSGIAHLSRPYFINQRVILAGAVISVGYLCYRWQIGEPMHRVTLAIGLAWIVLGVVTMFA